MIGTTATVTDRSGKRILDNTGAVDRDWITGQAGVIRNDGTAKVDDRFRPDVVLALAVIGLRSHSAHTNGPSASHRQSAVGLLMPLSGSVLPGFAEYDSRGGH